MKFSIALCLIAVYLFAEASAKPTAQFLEQAREVLNEAKEKAQEFWEQAQEDINRTIETARNAMQKGFNTVQQTVQNSRGQSETQSESETGSQDVAVVAA